MSYTPVGWANDETHPLSQANMKTLDGGIVDVDADLGAAASLATANQLVRRDGSGRARFASPSNASDAAIKSYVDDAVAAAVATNYGVIASGSDSGDFTITVPAGNWSRLSLFMRGVLTAVGDIAIRPNSVSTAIYAGTIYKLVGDGTSATLHEDGETSWRLGEWSTVIGTSHTELYFATSNTSSSQIRHQSVVGRYSTVASASKQTQSWGRVADLMTVTSIRVLTRGETTISSAQWWLYGARA